MKERLARFMMGRYGIDALSKFTLGIAIACMVLNLFFRNGILNGIAFLLLVVCYFRMFSRDIGKRYQENVKYWSLRNKVLRFFKLNKTHHIYRCPQCKQKIRIPKGKGKVEITCPKCRTCFIKRS